MDWLLSSHTSTSVSGQYAHSSSLNNTFKKLKRKKDMVFVTKMLYTQSVEISDYTQKSKHRSRERIYTVRYVKYPQPRLTTVCYSMEKTPDTNNSHRKHISSSGVHKSHSNYFLRSATAPSLNRNLTYGPSYELIR
jgi:hypothetical protein